MKGGKGGDGCVSFEILRHVMDVNYQQSAIIVLISLIDQFTISHHVQYIVLVGKDQVAGQEAGAEMCF